MQTKTNITFQMINRLAIPAIFAGIVEPLLSITDAVIIGNVPLNSVGALSAVGLAGSFISALVWGLSASGLAISSLVSQYLGKKQLKKIASLIPQVFYGHIIFGVFLVFLGLVFSQQIFDLYHAKGLIKSYAVQYFEIRIYGVVFTLLTIFMFGVFRGLQNTITAMYISWLGFVCNVILSLLFVYVLDWHIAGAAYASLISQVLMFLLALTYLIFKTPFSLHFNQGTNENLKPFLNMFFNFIARTFFINLVLFLANRQATSYGDDYIAAQTIAINIWLFSSFFIDGYANAGNAIAGRLLGENNKQGLWQLSLKLIKYSMYAAIFLMLVYTVFYNQIANKFIAVQAVQGIFKQFFWLIILLQPINAIAFVLDGVFKGLGKAQFLRNMLLLGTLFGFIPVLYFTAYLDLKMYSIWLAFGVWMLIRSSTLLYKLKEYS
jgi:putative MATE family efflux protein